MTRLYLQGRTETVRSLTVEAKEFVLAMVDDTVPPEEKYKLLHKAADLHAKMYKDCMNGKGIDRHLFALFIVSRGQGYVSAGFCFLYVSCLHNVIHFHVFSDSIYLYMHASSSSSLSSL